MTRDTHLAPPAPRFGVNVALGDVDDDGDLEIAATGWSNKVYLLDHELRPLPGWPQYLGEGIWYTPPALGDINGDTDLEIVVLRATESLDLHALHADGTPVSGFPVTLGPQTIINGFYPSLADIVIGTETRSFGDTALLFALDRQGSTLPGWPVRWAPSGSARTFYGFGSAALVDLDGDGRREVVAGRGDGNQTRTRAFSVYDTQGTEWPGYPRPTGNRGASHSNTPAVLDIDADGLLEAAWLNFDGQILVWDLAAEDRTDEFDWPMYRHDAALTGALPVRFLFRDGFESGDMSAWSTSVGQAAHRYENNYDSLSAPDLLCCLDDHHLHDQ